MNIDDLYRLLRSAHVQAQGIVDTIHDPLVVLDSNLCVQSASRSFYETFHVDRFETIGKPFHELGNGQWDIPDLRRLLTEVIPRATAIINYEVAHDFPGLGPRTMLLTARTLSHPDNAGYTMLVSIVDATDRVRRETMKDMLFGEMRHRVKNLFSAAQAIARLSETEGRTAQEFREDFLDRFRALAEAHETVFSGKSETGLRRLVEKILAPYAAPHTVVIENSEDEILGPNVLLSLSLALHELATNAAKYGALSASGGQVRVNWQRDKAGRDLRIRWVETGGPPVSPPSAQGYGTQLIESAIEYSLGGSVEQNFAPEGLVADLIVPLPAALPESDLDDAKDHSDCRR